MRLNEFASDDSGGGVDHAHSLMRYKKIMRDKGVAEATGDEEFDTMLSKITSPTAVNAQNREDTVNELIRTYFWHKRRADLGPEKTHEHGHEKIVLKILKKLNRMGIDLAKVDPVKLKMIKSQVYEQGVAEGSLEEGVNDPHIFKAIAMIGPMGAGKSTIARQLVGGSGLRSLNLDNFNELMIKQGKVVGGNLTSDQLERSWQLTQAQKSNWVNGRLGLLIDGSGRNIEGLVNPLRQLEALGYDTMVILVNVSLETSLQRQQSRAAQQAQQYGTGRNVPADLAKSSYDQIQKNIPKLQQLYGNKLLIINNEGAVDLRQEKVIVDKFLSAPPSKPAAVQWIKSQGASQGQQLDKRLAQQQRQQTAAQRAPTYTQQGVTEDTQSEDIDQITRDFVQHYENDPMGVFMHAKSSYLDAVGKAKNFSRRAAALYKSHANMSKQEFQDTVMKYFGKHLQNNGFPPHASEGWGKAEHELVKDLMNLDNQGVTEGQLNEKFKSQQQAKLMYAVAGNKDVSKKTGVSQKVAKEFIKKSHDQKVSQLPKKVKKTTEEIQTGGSKGLPFPGTYEQETNKFKYKGQRRTPTL